MKNILLSVVVIAMLVAGGVGGTLAGWQDEEVGEYCFTAGQLDLQLDLDGVVHEPFSTDLENPRDLICESGLEPGDSGKVVLSMHVISSPSGPDFYTTVNVTASALQDDENNLIGPESQAGDTTAGAAGVGEGELDDFLLITLSWDTDDDGDGDIVIYDGTYAALVSGLTPVVLCLEDCNNYLVVIEWELAGYGSTQSPQQQVNKCMTDCLGGRITFTALGPEFGECPAGTYSPTIPVPD